MYQSFTVTARPEQGPPRLKALRARLATEGFEGMIVPRADVHQGEYVAPHDERLSWLTGFTGSAGFCIVLPDIAGVFIDGRYRTQVKAQVALSDYTPVPWPDIRPGPWIAEHLAEGRIAFDPWLHTADEIAKIEEALAKTGVTLVPADNFIDAVWDDQPAPPCGKVQIQPLEFAGKSSDDKRADLAAQLRDEGQAACVITLPDSIAWLLNIRGSDVARNPVVHAFAILTDDGRLNLFIDEAKLDDEVRAHLGAGVTILPPEGFVPALREVSGPVRVDRGTAPIAVSQLLTEVGTTVAWGADPCLLPKARKNAAEVQGARDAHLRDGAAMAEFLAWLDATTPGGGLTEIDVVTQLESCRRATNALKEISFETIAGSGPNGAIMHYRVTEDTNRPLSDGELIVVDSGGQYVDGTTDITRTIAIGTPPQEAAEAYTRVLQGMIAISRVRWPRGLAGRDLDPLARYPLWLAGQDFNHGTGHGVGSYLSVHEGPQRLSKISEIPLEPGMILSNEPGYYREGAFGIRIENLVVVHEAPALPGGDAEREMLAFETLTFTPIDRRLVVPAMLSPGERDWLNAYHAEVMRKIGPKVSDMARNWLAEATAPI